MTEWKAKRFWTRACPVAVEGGFAVHLDTRPLRTPAKAELIVPTRKLADTIAAEWDAQAEQIDPLSMPATRAANAAIDKVKPQRPAVAELVAAYGETDLLCYRAADPEGLVQRQNAAWDPLLHWAEERFGVRLHATTGVMPVAQPRESIERLAAEVRCLDPFRLTALHDLVGLSGSLVIGLAAANDLRPAEEIWQMSRIDEDWQAELWGVDDEAAAFAAAKRQDFLHAHKFWHYQEADQR